VPGSWRLECEHALTGVPDNQWICACRPGRVWTLCQLPTQLLRSAYGFKDTFSGKLGDADTKWLGQPRWTGSRGGPSNPKACGLDPEEDIQRCRFSR